MPVNVDFASVLLLWNVFGPNPNLSSGLEDPAVKWQAPIVVIYDTKNVSLRSKYEIAINML
jgi:hypothetical protein